MAEFITIVQFVEQNKIMQLIDTALDFSQKAEKRNN